MEYIPHKIKCPTGATNKQGKPLMLDLHKEDLPVHATFISEDIGLIIYLAASEYHLVGDVQEKIEGTGCKVQFRGGHMVVKNSNILKLLMMSYAYLRNTVRIDPEDHTGFWRQSGMVKFEMRPVIVDYEVKRPTFDQLNPTKMIISEEPIQPIEKVI